MTTKPKRAKVMGVRAMRDPIPCERCGSFPIIRKYHDMWLVECTSMGGCCSLQDYQAPTVERAINGWNGERADPAQAQARDPRGC